MRIFIALDLNQEVKKELARLQDQFPEFLGKKTETENLHLTLKFLGELDHNQVEQVKLKLQEIKLSSFNARLSELGVFDERVIRIIWIHLLGTEALQKEIDHKLLFLFPKEERFQSHITLARVKNVRERKTFLEIIKKIKAKWAEFPITSFSLIKSVLTQEKPTYETLETYELEG